MPSARENFENSGYLLLHGLFSKEEMAEAKREIARVLECEAQAAARETVTHGGVWVGLSARSGAVRALNRDARILDVLEEIYSPAIEFLSDKVALKSSDTTFPSPWHQDWPYWLGSHKISVWLALDTATVENGCMRVLPGSHLSALAHDAEVAPGEAFGNRVRPESVDESLAVDAAMEAGGALFFHDLTLHSSHPNRTGQDRWAWIGTYRVAGAADPEYSWAVAAEVLR